MMKQLWVLTGIIALGLMNPEAAADDGVLEINQACAISGCLPGDSPGFPVTLEEPGSYRLTSNLYVGGASAWAIRIHDRNISLDLNGFVIDGGGNTSNGVADFTTNTDTGRWSLRNGGFTGFSGSAINAVSVAVENVRIVSPGPAILASQASIRDSVIEQTSPESANPAVHCLRECEVEGLVLFAVGGDGVYCLPPGFTEGSESCTIRSSRIQGAAGAGVRCGRDCAVENTLVLDSGGAGIVGDIRMKILDSRVINSQGGAGIQCESGCQVRGTTVSGSSEDGLNVGENSLVQDSIAIDNGGDGIQVGVGSTVIGNTSNENTNGGIRASRAATIVNNTVRNNGLNGTGSGIIADVGSHVAGNSSRSNGGFGLNAQGTLGYLNNVFTDNNDGDANPQILGAGAINLGGNICGTSTCP